MFFDIFCVSEARTQTRFRISFHQLQDQRLGWVAQFSWEIQVCILNVLQQLLFYLRIVRSLSDEHLVEKHSDQIPVDWLAVAFPLKHLRSQIRQGPTKTPGWEVIIDAFFTQAEISEFAVPILINNHIIRFHISKDDFSFMQILYG